MHQKTYFTHTHLTAIHMLFQPILLYYPASASAQSNASLQPITHAGKYPTAYRVHSTKNFHCACNYCLLHALMHILMQVSSAALMHIAVLQSVHCAKCSYIIAAKYMQGFIKSSSSSKLTG